MISDVKGGEMAEYIRILEYCEQTGLNKSKVYRAINSGKIKTKKIDGVMFINASLLPDKFKLPESYINEESNIEVEKVEKVEIETSNSKCEVVSVNNDIDERGYITIRHYEILQELYNKLESRTQVALDAQDDSIKILKRELDSKNAEIQRLLHENEKDFNALKNATEKSEITSIREVAFLPEEVEATINEKQQKIEELERLLNEKQDDIYNLENDLIPAQQKVIDLENQLEEMQTKMVQIESEELEGQIIDKQPQISFIGEDKTYNGDLEDQLKVLRRQLDSYQKELAEKQKIIDENQMSPKRDEFVTVLSGIDNKLNMPATDSKSNQEEFDKIIFEKQSRIDDLESKLSEFTDKVRSLEQQLIESQEISLDSVDNKSEIGFFNTLDEEKEPDKELVPVADVNKKWEELLHEKQKIIYDLENQLFEKQQRILSFDNTNKAQREINRLQTELDVSNGKVKQLKEENKRLMHEIPNQENLSIDVQQRFTFYHNEMTDLQTKIQRLELDIKEKNDIIRENDAIIKDKELRIKDIQDIADKRKNRIDDLKKELVSKHLKISKMGESSSESSLIPDFSVAGKVDFNNLQNELLEKDEKIKYLEAELKKQEQLIPTEGFGNADSIINALKEELEAAKMLLTNNSDTITIEKLSNLINQKDEEILGLAQQLEELKSSLNDQSLFSYNNEVSIDLDNTKDEKIEFLETDLKSKIDYIEMLEKTLNNMDKEKEGLKISGISEQIEQLTQEVFEKDEIIQQLKTKLDELEKPINEPELLTTDDSELQIKNELLEKMLIIESLEKQLEDVKNLNLNLENDLIKTKTGDDESELQNKIKTLEEETRLKTEQIKELEGKLVFDFEPKSFDSSEYDSKIKILELQIDSLIEDNNRKSQLIEELQYGQSGNTSDKASLSYNNDDSDLELEKFRLINDQMRNAMDSKEEEINTLKNKLANLEAELDDKTTEIKKERQKTISIALSKSKGAPLDSEESTFSEDITSESPDKVKMLELEIIKLSEYIESLKFQNIQLKQQSSQPKPSSGSGESNGWFNKL